MDSVRTYIARYFGLAPHARAGELPSALERLVLPWLSIYIFVGSPEAAAWLGAEAARLERRLYSRGRDLAVAVTRL